MIEILRDFPDSVVAANLSGQVSAADLNDGLVAEVLERREAQDAVRLLLHFTAEFSRFTTTLAWDDPTIGLHHLGGFARVAIVTDVPWLESLAQKLAESRPDDFRHFADQDYSTAAKWVSLE